MILHLADWKFDIDMERTMEYSASEEAEHCVCAYCRNFYASVDTHYPGLRLFLGKFGVDIEAPEEQLPYDYCGGMIYYSSYLVYGRVLSKGRRELLVDDVVIRILEDSNGEMGEDSCIALEFDLSLPWVLEEPMEDTASPANDPDFLKMMQERLLFRGKTEQQS